MNDAANHLPEVDSEVDTLPTESRDVAVPGIQPPSRSRYRPSEAWALRWLGPPSR